MGGKVRKGSTKYRMEKTSYMHGPFSFIVKCVCLQRVVLFSYPTNIFTPVLNEAWCCLINYNGGWESAALCRELLFMGPQRRSTLQYNTCVPWVLSKLPVDSRLRYWQLLKGYWWAGRGQMIDLKNRMLWVNSYYLQDNNRIVRVWKIQ